jgi:mono/diheme cytochrome c family protein
VNTSTIRTGSTRLRVLTGAFAALCSLSGQTSRSVRDGVYSADQAKRGRASYSEHCFECHGRDLRGDVETRPLTGGEFFSNWDGLPLSTLFERIRNTMPADKPATLGRQQVADIVAFLLQFDGFPAGSAELSTKPEILQQIRIETPKP